jgi:hypothetical protein
LAFILLASGVLCAVISVQVLVSAIRLDRPDAAVFWRKSIAMTISLSLFGCGLLLAGAYQLLQQGEESGCPGDTPANDVTHSNHDCNRNRRDGGT